ncbi:MFS transporter [Candidatus Uabimicrobium amorphum]|uniref:MFS transporter n=1 Tax=Uabimicrobium amorphum TaxID=2596890 RepID=A0A5S9IJV9_UABAM|nr:MFS transporter [Candidatus Uabimicrobium amorphum]BBM82400.1 MFS transporter [Candidatus Uabimicrobium amorphum]
MHTRNLVLLLLGNILSHIGTGITMLAIPWLLIKKLQATTTYGYLSIAAMALSILLLPYIGVIVDRFSRKTILLGVALGGFFTTFLCAMLPPESLYTLACVYLLGNIVYNFQFPTLMALIQEIFPVEMYERVNGWMEVQSQFAMMSAGGAAGILLDIVSLRVILIIDALTYLCAFALFAFLRYQKKQPQTQKKNKQSPSLWEGVTFIRKFPQTFLFLFLTTFTFISIIAFNYLLPTHIIRVLDGSAQVFGWSEIVWASGSITAGLTISRFLLKMSISHTIYLCFFVFTVVMGTHAFNHNIYLFVGIMFFLGWANASIRVMRNTAMMRIVDNHTIGRVNATIFALVNVMKMTVVFIMTLCVDYVGTSYCFFVLFLVLLGVLYALLRNNYTDV